MSEHHSDRLFELGHLFRCFSIVETERLDRIELELKQLNQKVDKIQMTIQDAIDTLAAENVKLDDISAKLTEGFTEITDLLGRLRNTTLTPDQEAIVTALQAKVDAVQPQAQSIADIVPNPAP